MLLVDLQKQLRLKLKIFCESDLPKLTDRSGRMKKQNDLCVSRIFVCFSAKVRKVKYWEKLYAKTELTLRFTNRKVYLPAVKLRKSLICWKQLLILQIIRVQLKFG